MTDLVIVQRDALRELFFETYNQGWLTEPSKSFRGLDTEIEARIAAMTVSPWQPIETAPRDGTPVLLYVQGQITEAWYSPLKPSTDYEGSDTSEGGMWVCADDEWQIEVEEIWEGVGKWSECSVTYDDGEATDWQPLPEPPTRNHTAKG